MLRFTRLIISRLLILTTLYLAVCLKTVQADQVLIQNVRIFNGVDLKLTNGHVLVKDGIIEKV